MDPGGRTLAGRYRLKQVIGRGGMSTVYRATDLTLGRIVAVKVLLAALADQDPTHVARFQREARAAAALDSSAVVTVYDTGIYHDEPYIVMEYIEGRSLAEVLADERPLEIPEALRITARVADALRAAHAAGILHRDIKPANVMIDDDGSLKVLDFGIARRQGGTALTETASVVGTAAYMAPERAVGEVGDARADIYSLGCLLYAMLVGHPPFGGEVAAAVLHQQINAPPRPPSELRAGIPAALDALVLEMLAKSPDGRPQDASKIRDRLVPLSGAALAAAGATGATQPSDRTAPTALLHRTAPTAWMADAAAARPPRSRGPLATLLADHRRRAAVMGLATAAVALAAIALLAGGSPRRAASTRPKPATMTITHTVPAATTATVVTSAPPANAKPPPAKPKSGHAGGHHGKKHDH